MKNLQNGLTTAGKDFLLSGHPLTRLEAIILFGIANLPDLIKEMRREGWVIHNSKVSYAAALKRVNEYATLKPPKNLPVKDVMITEYRVSR